MKMTLKLFSFFTLSFSLLCNCLNSTPIQIDDPLDFRILDQFFRITVTQSSEYGYVLQNSKPISAMDIFSLERLPAPQSPWFAMNICSREAIEVWKRIHPSQKDIVLKITKIVDPDSRMTKQELLFINIPKLRRTIESNINLFRYVLGPSLDPITMLDHIVKSPESLYTILRDDRVLIGIVLGFGVYNSLMESRAEAWTNCTTLDTPPFSGCYDLMHNNMDSLRLRAFFLSSVNNSPGIAPTIKPSVTPGLGFTSIKDELNFIDSQRLDLPEVLVKEKPQFIFGTFKNAENFQLTNELQITQKYIQTILDRPDFLEYVLEKITGEKPIINCTPHQNERFILEGNVEQAVAKVIWNTYSHLDHFTVSEFIEAFCRRDPQDTQRSKLNLLPGSLPGLEQARSNLKFAEEQLAAYSQKGHLEAITPGYLYFERLKVGNGNGIDSANELLLSYTIEDGHGNVLSAAHNGWVKLSETIPGFILGIQGMKEKETRKIYIHPAYGYGVSTTLPPCTFLIANITLHQVNSHSKDHVNLSSSIAVSKLPPLDLSWVKDPEIFLEIQHSSYQLARSLGSLWGIWLGKSHDLNFSQLCNELRSLAKTPDNPSLSIEEQRLCNQVFWNLNLLSSTDGVSL